MILVSAVLGLVFGFVALAVWSFNEPTVETYSFYGGSYAPLVNGDETNPEVFGSYFPDREDPRLHMSSWIAVPASTALIGLIIGYAASVAGFRITRYPRTRPGA